MSALLQRTASSFVGFFAKIFGAIVLQLIDITITILNLFSFRRKHGAVVPLGLPGANGVWPEFNPPTEKDSRSPCPALNALANHGIIPRDGKNIPFKTISKAVRETYNFSPTFSWFVPHYAAEMLGRNYDTDTLNLSDLNVHNGIEHDASLIRQDILYEPDQSRPDHELIDRLLALASGKDRESGKPILTLADVAKFSHIRRTECKVNNPQFTLDTLHKIFGSNNAATMAVVFGGKVDDLEIWLKEERLPQGWQPSNRDRFGLSMASFNRSVFAVEFKIPNSPYRGSELKTGDIKSEAV